MVQAPNNWEVPYKITNGNKLDISILCSYKHSSLDALMQWGIVVESDKLPEIR